MRTTKRERSFSTGLTASLSNGWERKRSLLCLLLATQFTCGGQTFEKLVDFNGTNGANPDYMTMIQGMDGNLYGTTSTRGANGDGTVFKLTPGGTLTTLHDFNGTDGLQPYAGVVLATDGSFYGTAQGGGGGGGGTVFKITPTGTVTVLHTFSGANGSNPSGPLVQTAGGTFYGTTLLGGAAGLGTIFKLTPPSGFTSLYSFAGTDGKNPNNGLVQTAANGNFYGTTEYGGANSYGTIFRLTPAGMLTTLHNFAGSDGISPLGTLVQGNNGTFYGTTPGGGVYGYGTVFNITSSGALTTIYNFTGGNDGAQPRSGSLALATDGRLYGTTSKAGLNGGGTIFSINTAGVLTTLYSFAGNDGADSEGGMVQATNGTLYGTTFGGGAIGLGTVFSLNVGLRPFVKTVPASGAVGSAVKILGTNLTGATGVTFNGTPVSSYIVVSRTLITTTVPTGATTGFVNVTIPAGTLKSNPKFVVTP